jgi:sucrose 6(F)-phosphate phosphorylase
MAERRSFADPPALITYPDSLGGNLRALVALLEGPFAGIFGSVHVLPPFRSSGDRGFAALDHAVIEPRFGDWTDIERIAERTDVVLDLICNHVSSASEAFQDYLRRGDASPSAPLFLRVDRVFPAGPTPEEDAAIFRRRRAFSSTYRVGPDQTPVELWTTFGVGDPSDMIDLDIEAPETRARLAADLDRFVAHGVRAVRLDAVAFTVKRAGTSCFLVEPGFSELMAWFRDEAGARGIELIGEVHAPRPELERVARWSRPYDFAFPALVLEALVSGEGDALASYLPTMHDGWITTLDTHDGIPIQPDLDGILPVARLRRLVAEGEAAGGVPTRLFAVAGRPDPSFDAHQLCITLRDLLGSEDALYAAHVIQAFSPGIPQVYYVGLLDGRNDRDAPARTGDRRAINRHDYAAAELDAALATPSVRRTVELLRLRASLPPMEALHATLAGSVLTIVRTGGDRVATAVVDLRAHTADVDVRAR